MKNKKRKSTALWRPRLQEAIRTDQIWVRSVGHTWHHVRHSDRDKYYEISIEQDLFIDGAGLAADGYRISLTDAGHTLFYRFLDSHYNRAYVKFTTDGEAWFQDAFAQILILFRLGAYRSESRSHISDWF